MFGKLGRAATVLLVALLCLVSTGLRAAMPAGAAESAGPTTDDVTIAEADPLLDDPQRGAKAIRQLGDQLPVAAARNDLEPSQLRSLLRNDGTAWVDPQGSVFYVDPAPAGATGSAASASAAPVAPLAQTFSLHSNPSANLTILLDFDGADVSGTGWNDSYGVTPGSQPAWDPAGDGAGFSDSEKLAVQQVWSSVAEDYAPFDVDVTTEDTGPQTIERASSADPVYGTRVLITPGDDPFSKICARNCGGVAYLSVFDRVGSYSQPAWVFPQALGNDAKNVAEAAAHEAGHNLGLSHDGTSTLGYYAGHGLWAPIMGVGYDRPLVQWSAGSYAGANNTQDDVAILTGYLGARPDEAPGSPATPSALPGGTALIGTRDDADSYLLGTCAPGSVVNVLPDPTAPDLDVRAVLRDAAGTQRAVAEPASAFADRATASGLGATMTIPDTGDSWVLTVEGVGQGTWSAGGYDDYGSLGTYTVSAPGCDGAQVDGVPSAPNSVSAAVDGTDSLTMSWSAPDLEGDGPVTGYLVTRSGTDTTETLPASARSHTFTGLSAGTTYQLAVRAVNVTGAGPAVVVNATTNQPLPAAPSAPRTVTGSYNAQTGKLQAWWSEPENAGTSPISGYAIYLDGGYLGQLGATSRGVDITSGSGSFAAGDHVIGIAAVNAVGTSPRSDVTVTVPPRPANDDVANAEVLTGTDGTVSGDNTYATRESTDPTPPSAYGAGGYSVWYAWTPADDGQVSLATSGGAFNRDTTLAAYTGSPGALTQIAGNDDTNQYHAAISFAAKAGTRYLIAVDGFSTTGGTGPFTLNWSQQPPSAPAAPLNVQARSGDTSATVTWTAAVANGSAVTGYTVIARAAGDETHSTDVGGTATSAVLTGLTNGRSYAVTVTATNAVGTSPASAAVDVVPDVPDTQAPTIGGVASNRRIVDPFFGSGLVAVRVHLTDDRGIDGAPVIQIGPNDGSDEWYDGGGWVSSLSASATLSRGDRRDGIWTATFQVPWSASTGSWSAWTSVADASGNTSSTGRGVDTIFVVAPDPLEPGLAPAALRDVTATPGDGRAQVSWSPAPTAVTDYTIWVSPGTRSVTVDGNQKSTVVEGLDDDTAYTFTVVAGNRFGESLESASAGAVTPGLVPVPPTGVTAAAGDRGATISWRPEYFPGDVTAYRVTARGPGDEVRTVTADAGATSLVVDGLTNGDSYTFDVVALNDHGSSQPSAASNPVVPAGVPTRPSAVTATRGDRSATVTWTHAEGNGAPVTGYTVTSSPGGITKTVGPDVTSTTITGLTNGTAYRLTVVATNAVGDSPVSEASAPVVPATTPGKVARFPVKVHGNKAVITWSAPVNGGSAITGYLVTVNGKARSVAGTAHRLVLTKLKPGVYKVQVAARNVLGYGPGSVTVKFRVK